MGIFSPQILEYIGLLLGVLTAIVIATKNGRDFFIKRYKNWRKYTKSKKEMPFLIKNIDERLKKVEYEISPNGGGSMKDSLKIIKAEIEATNWLSPRPMFRCTSKGLNIFVNEAYCQLCGVTSSELLKLGWRNFSADLNQMDHFYERWLAAADTLSQFTGKLKIQNNHGEYRGEWTIRIRLLGAIDSEPNNDYLWHGSLYPYDQDAKEYAKEYNIPTF
jgi:PAS domain-containing protein